MDRKLTNKNCTLFYTPLWTETFDKSCDSFNNDRRFFEVEKNKCPQYLLPFVTNIYKDDTLYRSFELRHEYIPKICMYREKLGLNTEPELNYIKIHCFATGCAFVEFFVSYENLSLEEIENFAYEFKKTTRVDKNNGYSITVYDILTDLFLREKNIEFNFSGVDFKQECRMFHHIYVDEKPDGEALNLHLRRLARGYKTSFNLPASCQDYDMIYAPYDYDYWAGSQEGIVNLFSHGEDPDTNYYIDNYKRSQLVDNYAFMYLLLLNQRFTTIKLVSQITIYKQYSKKEKMLLTERIVALKTVFSFNVVSDDHIYQNVYKKMYDLMDIDRFLADIKDNEQQVEMFRNYESLESEKRTNSLLVIISALSVFSVLIDASSYFDRIPYVREISTGLSFACLVGIIASYFIWWRKHFK